jgi:hypothetical protein
LLIIAKYAPEEGVRKLALSNPDCKSLKFSWSGGVGETNNGWIVNCVNSSSTLFDFNLSKLQKFYDLTIPLLQTKYTVEFRAHEVNDDDFIILKAMNASW